MTSGGVRINGLAQLGFTIRSSGLGGRRWRAAPSRPNRRIGSRSRSVETIDKSRLGAKPMPLLYGRFVATVNAGMRAPAWASDGGRLWGIMRR